MYSLMRNRCKDTIEANKEAWLETKFAREYEDPNLSNLREDPRSKKFVDRVQKMKGTITEKDLDKARKRLYGSKNEQGLKEQLILKIGAALSKRPDVAEVFYSVAYDYTYENMANIQVPVQKLFLPPTAEGGVAKVNLMELPYNMMVVLGGFLDQELLTMNPDSDINIGTGFFGNLRLEILTERSKALRTNAPQLLKFFNQLKLMNQNKESIETRFMSSDPDVLFENYDYEPLRDKDGFVLLNEDKTDYKFSKTPLLYNRRMFGLNDMYRSVLPDLYDRFGRQYFKTEEQFMMLMHQIMLDQVRIDYDGSLWLMRDKGKRMEGEKVIRHEDSGEPQYKWYGKEPLIVKNGQIMNYDPKLRKEALEQQTTDEKSDDFKYWYPKKGYKQVNMSKFDRSLGKSHHEALIDWISGVQVNLWAFGTYAQNQANETTDKNIQLLVRASELHADGKLSTEDRDFLYEMNHKLMEGIDSGEMAGFHGLDSFELKSRKNFFFPKKYTPGNFIRGMGEGIESLQEKLLNLRNKVVKPSQRKDLRDNMMEMDKSIAWMEEKLGMFQDEDQSRDSSASKNPTFNLNYVKGFKSSTNSIDEKYVRLDENVARDYIGEVVAQLERRKLVNGLLEVIIETGNKPKMRKVAINLFNKAYNDPTSKGSIFGVRFDNDQFNKVLNMVLPSFKGWGKGTRDHGKFLKSIANVGQFNLLSGPLDGVKNLMSLMQDGFNSGFRNVWDAQREFRNNRDYWERKAELAGVITFSKYYEGYVDTFMRNDDIKDLKLLQDELKVVIRDIEKQNITSSKKANLLKRYNAQLKAVKANIPSKLRKAANDLVQLAVTHRFQMGKDWGDANPFKKAMGSYEEIPSIAETEKTLRTISFIVGYKNAKRITKNDPTFKGTPGEKKIINMAREYVYITQFGLEPHLVGDALGNDAAKFWNSITTWRKNKTSYDARKLKEWSRARWNPNRILNLDEKGLTDKKRVYGVLKSLEALVRPMVDYASMNPMKRAKAIRQIAPSIGSGNSLLFIHGIGTVLTNFIMFAHPASIFASWGFRRVLLSGGGGQILPGFASPYMTGAFAIGGYAAALHKLHYGEDEYCEIDFWEHHRVLRALYGVGASDVFTMMMNIGNSATEYVTGETQVKEDDYYEDPARHYSFKHGVFGDTKKFIVDPLVEKAKDKKTMLWDNRKLDYGGMGY